MLESNIPVTEPSIVDTPTPSRHEQHLEELDAASRPVVQVRPNLIGCTLGQIEQFLQDNGEAAFRGLQVFNWIFARRAGEFETMSNISKKLRAKLAMHFDLTRPRIDERHISRDGTRKYRFVAPDGTAFESVYIPDVGRTRKTNTLCISSQSGCAVGCKFCFTASLRRNRNLSAAEIVGQVLAVRDDVAPLGASADVTNIVFMGMGEPLLNFANVVQAARILIDPQGMSFSTRRVTISTSGIVPRIYELGAALPTQLAISLNATTDEIRTKIMPINKKWPLAELTAAMRAYPLSARRRITVEYVLLGGLNDSLEDAKRLPKLLHDIPVKINLLPLNPHDRTPFTPPTAERVKQFKDALYHAGFNVSVRTPRGQDISAACGQLGEAAQADIAAQAG